MEMDQSPRCLEYPSHNNTEPAEGEKNTVVALIPTNYDT